MQLLLKPLFVLVVPLLLVLTSSDGASQSPSEAPGIKITVRTVADGMSGEQTNGPHIAAVTRCDLGQTFELNLDAREYHSAPYPPKPFTKGQMEARGIKLQSSLPGEPTLLIETATVDTGERKEIFGHTARHVITTRKETPLEGSQSEPQETMTDGWYIDLNNRISCDRKWREGGHAYVYVRNSTDSRPPDTLKFVDTGKPETGFAVELKTTSRGTYTLPDGTKKENTSTSEMTITQLQEGPLDPAVFEIPAGFRQVAHSDRNPGLDWKMELASAWERFKARVERIFN